MKIYYPTRISTTSCKVIEPNICLSRMGIADIAMLVTSFTVDTIPPRSRYKLPIFISPIKNLSCLISDGIDLL